jgi:hypothetical protein
LTKAELEAKMDDYYQFRDPSESAKAPKLITDETDATVDLMKTQREIFLTYPELIAKETAEVQAEVDRLSAERRTGRAVQPKPPVYNPKTGEWENFGGVAISLIAVCVMAGASVWGAYESTVQGQRAIEYQNKIDAQNAIDRAQMIIDKKKAEDQQRMYTYITYAGLGISAVSLIVFLYMVMRK